MQVADCCPMIRQLYAEIGGGEQGYIPKAIDCVLRVLNTVASDEKLPKELRRDAAYAAANLLISDHKD